MTDKPKPTDDIKRGTKAAKDMEKKLQEPEESEVELDETEMQDEEARGRSAEK